MSTAAQVDANRNNAQHSTGARSEEGKQRSAVNATKHGFCGQRLIFHDNSEKEAYEIHCISMVEQHQPQTHEENSLIQQYADQQWTLHQISVMQINFMSMMNAAIDQLINDQVEPQTRHAALAPFYKQLNTLGVYEQRRRRAAQETLAQFQQLVEARQATLVEAAQICKTLKAQGKPFNPAEFGFVYALPEIEAYLAREAARTDAAKQAKSEPRA